MADHLSSLSSTLNKLLQQYRKLLGLAEEQRTVLISGDNERLVTITAQMSAVVELINDFESSRVADMAALAEEFALSEGEQTAAGLAKHLPQSQASNLTRVADELKRTMTELDALNQHNAELTIQSVNYYSQLIKWISESVSSSTYGARTGQNSAVSPRFISVQS